MFAIRAILLALEVVVSLLLTVLVLMQKSKSGGGGLGTAFGGGMSESLFGSRAGNVLTRATIILSIIFFVNTTILAVIIAGQHEKTIMDKFGATAPLPFQQQPAGGPVSTLPGTYSPPTTESAPADPPVQTAPTLGGAPTFSLPVEEATEPEGN